LLQKYTLKSVTFNWPFPASLPITFRDAVGSTSDPASTDSTVGASQTRMVEVPLKTLAPNEASAEAEGLINWLTSCPRCRRVVLSIRGHLCNPLPTEWGLIRLVLGRCGMGQELAIPSGDSHTC
jgi:hypothetical protein